MTNALLITKSFELTAPQAQALVDLEACVADMGLEMFLMCLTCRAAQDDANCHGNAEPHDDGSMTFSAKCNCTNRAYRGYLVAPSPPRPLRHRRLDLTVRPEVAITRPQMKVFADAADALHQLRLFYGLRCLACRMEDRDSDGAWGVRESNASHFVIECSCTRRIYQGSDAPLVQ